MDLRIGLTQTAKELQVQLPDDSDQGKVQEQIESALAEGGTLWLTDRKGRRVGVVGAKVAYVEIGSPEDERRIGFGG